MTQQLKLPGLERPSLLEQYRQLQKEYQDISAALSYAYDHSPHNETDLLRHQVNIIWQHRNALRDEIQRLKELKRRPLLLMTIAYENKKFREARRNNHERD